MLLPKIATSVSIYRRINRVDPTRTLTLRNRFEAEMKRRFSDIKKAIKAAIVDSDCFGLVQSQDMIGRLIIQAKLDIPTHRQFDFPLSQQKKDAFMAWLQKQEELGILETMRLPRIGGSIDSNWSDVFIRDSYQRGVQRARYELTGAGYPVPTLAETGGLVASMSTPFHIERLGVCYSRCFDQLKGITAAMDSQISAILAQGLADGDNPNVIARKLLDTIDYNPDSPYGLQIRDTLGRFISGERRARTLARTEIIRSHHLAMVQEYENWAVEGVRVVAEWVTTGFKVCPECLAMSVAGPYTLEEIKYKIPLHPNCRCCIIPVPYEEKR